MGGIEGFLAERGGVLLRAARVLTGDDGHAEDLLQTALAKSLGAYATLSSEHKFEAYLRTTMYRTYVSWWRRRNEPFAPTCSGWWLSALPERKNTSIVPGVRAGTPAQAPTIPHGRCVPIAPWSVWSSPSR